MQRHPENPISIEMSRRQILKTAALIVSFGTGAIQSEGDAQIALAVPSDAASGSAPAAKPVDPGLVDSFLAMHPDGSVTIYTGKVDIGTGLRIAIRQMAAEELGLSTDRIALVEGDTALTPDQGSTGGSTGLTRGGLEVRKAAATARDVLLRLAAQRLQIPVEQLALVNGRIGRAEGSESKTNTRVPSKDIPVSELLSDSARVDLKVDFHANLKHHLALQVIGRPIPRPDIPAKCTGGERYVQDLTLPNMLHARVIRPASIEAKLLAVDETPLRGIPGARVVRVENFLAVTAKDEWAAIRASRALKATWSDAATLPGSQDLEKHVREMPIAAEETIVERGDSAAGIRGATKQMAATYFWPCQSHGSLGPSCAVADVRDGGATIWTSSQGTHHMRVSFSKIFGLDVDKVRVIYLDGAGSYGGNGNDDAAADAVLISKTVGQPVRVQWMRHDEHGWDPKGPQQLIDLRAGVDRYGRIVAWETEMWVPAMLGPTGTIPLLAPAEAGIAQPSGQWPGMIAQNGDPPYLMQHLKAVAHRTQTTPLRPSHLRAPGKVANTFAVECFTDELAADAGTDPVTYRELGLSDFRAIDVLRRAASMIGWKNRPSPNPSAKRDGLLIGRGIAYTHYKQSENYIATAMEVAVDPASGKITVQRVTCAHDCGLVVNPDSLQNQIEGSILQTISRTLHEEVKFDRSRVTSVDWAGYPILRFPEAPIVTVALIDRPEMPMLGAGEASCAPVAAALGNAVFDATGVRLRAVPFTPDKVKAALDKAAREKASPA